MNNKSIFASNLKKYMKLNNKSRRQICDDLGFSYYTFSDWVNGKKYPRMDRVEQLANYFGILKSDLIEEKPTEETKKDNDSLAEIIVKIRMNKSLFEVVEKLTKLDDKKLSSINQLLDTFIE